MDRRRPLAVIGALCAVIALHGAPVASAQDVGPGSRIVVSDLPELSELPPLPVEGQDPEPEERSESSPFRMSVVQTWLWRWRRSPSSPVGRDWRWSRRGRSGPVRKCRALRPHRAADRLSGASRHRRTRTRRTGRAAAGPGRRGRVRPEQQAHARPVPQAVSLLVQARGQGHCRRRCGEGQQWWIHGGARVVGGMWWKPVVGRPGGGPRRGGGAILQVRRRGRAGPSRPTAAPAAQVPVGG